MRGAKKVRQAVILAGGLGTRLMPLTKNTPKPMVLVNNMSFLEYLISLLKDNGIEEIVLLLGYLADKVQKHFGDGSDFGVKIKYSVSSVSTETGKRIKKAAALLDDVFLLMYCDNYWPLNLKEMMKFYISKNKKYMMTAYSNSLGITKNNVLISKDNIVLKYDKGRKDKDLNGVDIGFFILNKDILKLMPSSNFSFEKSITPKLIKKRELAAYTTNIRYYSISTVEKLKLTEEFLRPKKIALIDRDGIINKRPLKARYIKNWKQFKFLPGAIKSMGLLKRHGFKLILISNQAGIGRGLMTEKDLQKIHENMQKALKEKNADLDAIYYCPHSWEDNCECRKPKPGMILRAANDLSFDITKAVFIGDDERDVQTGKNAGCKTILISRGNAANSSPDMICKSFEQAAELLANHKKYKQSAI